MSKVEKAKKAAKALRGLEWVDEEIECWEKDIQKITNILYNNDLKVRIVNGCENLSAYQDETAKAILQCLIKERKNIVWHLKTRKKEMEKALVKTVFCKREI